MKKKGAPPPTAGCGKPKVSLRFPLQCASDSGAPPPNGLQKPISYFLFPIFLFIFLSILSLCIFTTISGGLPFPFGKNAAKTTKFSQTALFSEELASCDKMLAASLDSPSLARPRLLAARLNYLDSLASSAESRVQVLKRQRILAKRFSQYQSNYKTAALKHASAFPATPLLAALAAEALVTSGEAEKAVPYAIALAKTAKQEKNLEYAALSYEISSLCGLLSSLERVKSLSDEEKTAIEGVFSLLNAVSADKNALIYGALLDLSENSGRGEPSRAVILAAAAAKQGENRETHEKNAQAKAEDERFTSFAAAYNYDFGDALTAARLYGQLGGAQNTSLAAGAYALSGNVAAARPLWRALASAPEKSAVSESSRLAARYNLACSGENAQLERLLSESAKAGLPERLAAGYASVPTAAADAYIFGMIRFTRLQERARALDILERSPLSSRLAVLDMEILRRQIPAESRERTLPLTWLLTGRHPDDERVYEWAAWYFCFCRAWEENAILLQKTAKFHTDGRWYEEYLGLTAMREGRLEEAVKLFTQLQPKSWQANANLGLIYEAKREWKNALPFYAEAEKTIESEIGSKTNINAVNVINIEEKPGEAEVNAEAENTSAENALRKALSRVELSLARCQEGLGGAKQARDYAERSLLFDSENINAQIFLERGRRN